MLSDRRSILQVGTAAVLWFMLSSYTSHYILIDSRSSVHIISHIKNCCKTVFTHISSLKIYVTLVLDSLHTLCVHAWLHQSSYFSSWRTAALTPWNTQLELRVIKRSSLRLEQKNATVGFCYFGTMAARCPADSMAIQSKNTTHCERTFHAKCWSTSERQVNTVYSLPRNRKGEAKKLSTTF